MQVKSLADLTTGYNLKKYLYVYVYAYAGACPMVEGKEPGSPLRKIEKQT